MFKLIDIAANFLHNQSSLQHLLSTDENFGSLMENIQDKINDQMSHNSLSYAVGNASKIYLKQLFFQSIQNFFKPRSRFCGLHEEIV